MKKSPVNTFTLQTIYLSTTRCNTFIQTFQTSKQIKPHHIVKKILFVHDL